MVQCKNVVSRATGFVCTSGNVLGRYNVLALTKTLVVKRSYFMIQRCCTDTTTCFMSHICYRFGLRKRLTDSTWHYSEHCPFNTWSQQILLKELHLRTSSFSRRWLEHAHRNVEKTPWFLPESHSHFSGSWETSCPILVLPWTTISLILAVLEKRVARYWFSPEP